MILAIDLGGTKVDLALVSPELEISSLKSFESEKHSSLEEIIQIYLKIVPTKPTAVCAGVAGPITNGEAKVTNLPWSISISRLAKEFGSDKVWLINDLEACAWGASHLSADGLVSLNAGIKTSGNRAVISAGTGLGQAFLTWDGSRFIPSASEGGHADFSPASKQDCQLLQFLFEKHDHVSWERVVSGKYGFRNIYDFLVHANLADPCEQLEPHKSSLNFGQILAEAASNNSQVAIKVLENFCRYYGAEAGNLALKTMAIGGVYIGGGIAPKIFKHLETGAFYESFCSKGRFKKLMEKIPINIIIDPHCALKGAAACAIYKLEST